MAVPSGVESPHGRYRSPQKEERNPVLEDKRRLAREKGLLFESFEDLPADEGQEWAESYRIIPGTGRVTYKIAELYDTLDEDYEILKTAFWCDLCGWVLGDPKIETFENEQGSMGRSPARGVQGICTVCEFPFSKLVTDVG